MKFCSHCGKELHEEAVICVNCGCNVEEKKAGVYQEVKDDTMSMVVKIFLIVGCVSQGWLLLPLAWCIPITVSVFGKLKNQQSIGTGLKICVLIFVNLIAGVCLLCMDDSKTA